MEREKKSQPDFPWILKHDIIYKLHGCSRFIPMFEIPNEASKLLLFITTFYLFFIYIYISVSKTHFISIATVKFIDLKIRN